MPDYGVYVAALALTTALSLFVSREMTRICLVVIAASAIGTIYNEIAGTYCPWLLFMLLDMAAFMAIIHFAETRLSVAAALIYFAQFALDGAYGAVQVWNGFPADPIARTEYWDWLAVLSFAQLAILIIGGACRGGRRLISARLSHSRAHRPDAVGSVQSGGGHLEAESGRER